MPLQDAYEFAAIWAARSTHARDLALCTPDKPGCSNVLRALFATGRGQPEQQKWPLLYASCGQSTWKNQVQG